MELIYLVVGVGLGIVASRLTRSVKEPVVSEEPRVSTPPMPQAAEVKEQPPLKEELQPLKEELKQTQLGYQMAREMSQFKGGFLARTSHELRSPLSSLMGMHQLILSDLCDSPEEAREFVAQAHVSAQKMVKLLDEVIAVAKTEHGTNYLETRSLQLIKIFQEVELLTHMQAANRNLHLKMIAPEPEIYVLADPRRFRQVLMGLVDSTIAQMEEGTIQVSATSCPDSQQVHIWMDIQCPNEIWSEPIDLLSTNPNLDSKPDETGKISPGLTLLIAQTLVEVMAGRLELLVFPDKEVTGDSASPYFTCRLQCSMPLAIPETVEQVLVGE